MGRISRLRARRTRSPRLARTPTWKLWRFHVDFVNPANSTFTLAGSLVPAPFSIVCGGSAGACVPQAGTGDTLDTLGDRSMFRNAYRRFTDGHEALVGNMTVESNGVAGIRWYEINNATSGSPGFVQQSTYQPDDHVAVDGKRGDGRPG